MPIYHALAQRTPEWFFLRAGRPTASEFHRIVTPTGKLSTQSLDYMHRLLAELMLGRPLEDDLRTPYMDRGTELEDAGISAYEFARDCETQPGGFITDDLGRYGCSPDRLIGDDGDLEMKIPAANTHIGYLLNSAELEKEKGPQVQGRLLIHGRKWVDLVSFHPELPLVVRRVYPNEKYIAILRETLDVFCTTLQEMRLKLENEYGAFPELKPPKPSKLADDDPGVLGVSMEDFDRIVEARKGAQ
jgi:hypothetical protein